VVPIRREDGENVLGHLTAPVRARLLLGAIVAGYLVFAALYATRVPLWNAPDEPAHYNYIASIAIDHQLPVLRPGDYNQQLLDRLVSAHFPPGQSVASLRYESHQPPLYYLIAAPVLAVTRHASLRTQVVALRLVTVLIGALFVLATYRLARLIFRRSEVLPLAAAAFVAFIPMHLFMDASIDNDALAELMLCLTLIVLVDDLQECGKAENDWRAGLVVGLAILSKLVAAVSAVLVVVGFLGSAYLATDRAAALRRLPRRLVRAGSVSLVVSGWWVVRNLVVYGWKDPFALRRHAVVVVDQPLTGRLSLTLVRSMSLTLFHSFWGQFGWMGIPYADRTYDVIEALSALVALGALLFGWQALRSQRGGSPSVRRFKGEAVSVTLAAERWAWGLLLAEVVLVIGGVVFYNLRYLQPQGRYLFPTLPTLAMLAAAGVAELFRDKYVALVLTVAVLGLCYLDWFSLVQVIAPAFAAR
jgi:4-amino-4-deoxy-L-arabinose transferase-like glycosyltransferase